MFMKTKMLFVLALVMVDVAAGDSCCSPPCIARTRSK